MVHVPHSYYFTFAALSNGALRLVDTGSTQFGGRLEVYYNSEWGTVCDDGWEHPDAAVACRQMGFGGVTDSHSSLFSDGASSQSTWLDEVACSGLESRLIDCNHAGIGSGYCFNDVGIVCTTGELGKHYHSISDNTQGFSYFVSAFLDASFICCPF